MSVKRTETRLIADYPTTGIWSLGPVGERNPLRAKLVRRAEQWRWSSLYRWLQGPTVERELLAPWPTPRQPGWVERVNAPQTEAEAIVLQRSIDRGAPLGDERWLTRTVDRLGLESTLRPRGRPYKTDKGS